LCILIVISINDFFLMILVTFCLVYIIALFIQQLSPQAASVLNKIKYQSSVVNVNNPNPNSTNHNHNPETKTPTATGGCVVFKGQVSGTCVRGSNVLTPFVHRFLTIDDLPCQHTANVTDLRASGWFLSTAICLITVNTASAAVLLIRVCVLVTRYLIGRTGM